MRASAHHLQRPTLRVGPATQYNWVVSGRTRRRKQRWTIEELGLLKESEVRTEVYRSIRSLNSTSLDMHFQPIVDLQTHQIFAQEALVRCNVEGLEHPEALLRRAIEEESMGRLGRMIRDATFSRVESQRIFVNIHPEELSSRWLIRPDDPLCLFDGEVYLEITESAAFDYFELCSNVLKEICARTGAKLVVDDFGAGYSNLKRVVDLEPSIVKLDRALITGIDHNRRQQVLVEQLVATCSALGAETVAEGIETQGEYSAVVDCGVRFGQGYLLARPAYPPPTPVVPR